MSVRIMNRPTRLALLAITLSLCAWTQPTQAAVSIEADIDKNTLRVGETAILTVIISSDGDDQLHSPSVQTVPGLDIANPGSRYSMNFTLVNGQRTFVNRLELTYEVTPHREGEFTIDTIRVATSSGYVTASPVEIHVSNEGSRSEDNNPTVGGNPEANRFGIHVVGRVDKEEAFVGEEIILTYYLLIPREFERHFRVNGVNEPSGQFRNFWIENHDLPRNREERYLPLQNNRSYKQLTLMRVSLFALSAGNFSIDALELDSQIAEGQVGMIIRQFQPLTIRSNVVELTINSLPEEGKPELFQGAVGHRYRLTADVNQRELREGEPVTLKIQLEGHGNIRNAPRPILPDLNKFDRFDPTMEESIQVLPSGVLGRLNFSYVLIPRDSTVTEIGPVRYVFFDTDTNEYIQLHTDPIPLSIESIPGGRNGAPISRIGNRRLVTRVGDDFRFISTSPLALTSVNLALYQSPLFWSAASLPLLIIGGAVSIRRRIDFLAKNPEAARRLRAPSLAHKALSQARAALTEKNKERMYTLARKAITDYLDHRWGLSCAGLTTIELETILEEKGYPAEIVDSVSALLRKTDDMRFSGADLMDGIDAETDLRQTEEILIRVMNGK